MKPVIIPETKLQKVDYIIEATSLIILLTIWGTTLYSFNVLPKQIPIHFNFKGEVDNYGNKATIIIIPMVFSFVYGLLSIVQRNPKHFNFPVKINEFNIQYQYKLAHRLIRTFKASIGLSIFFLNSITINAATNGSLPFGNWFIILIILPIISPLFIYLFLALKNK